MDGRYTREVIQGGLRVVCEEIPHVRSVSIGVWVGSGSRVETAEVNGISHFIEHMLFKGTRKRSAREIAEAIDSVGGQLNAFTGKEYTCFYCKVLDEHFSLAVDLLSDMLINSTFEPKEIEREKGVILEEIKMYLDSPDELVHDLLAQALWGDTHLGRNIVGTVEAVSGLTRERILEHMARYYTPINTVIAAVGHIEHAQVVQEIQAHFHMRPGQAPPALTNGACQGSRLEVQEKDTEQVHLCVGLPAYPLDHPDLYSLHVLNTALGGATSSRLFQEIRENRGLAYSVYSYQSAYRDTGLLGIYIGLSPRVVDEVLSLVLEELEDIREHGLTDAEVIRAREQLKGGLMLGLESTSSRMSRLGKSELSLNKILTPEEILRLIDDVTPETVRAVAQNVLKPESCALSAVGPVKAEKLERFLMGGDEAEGLEIPPKGDIPMGDTPAPRTGEVAATDHPPGVSRREGRGGENSTKDRPRR